MVEMVVTKEQADLLRTATEAVVVRGPDGTVLGVVRGASTVIVKNEAEILERIRQRRGQPQRWFTTAEVFEQLNRLEGG